MCQQPRAAIQGHVHHRGARAAHAVCCVARTARGRKSSSPRQIVHALLPRRLRPFPTPQPHLRTCGHGMWSHPEHGAQALRLSLSLSLASPLTLRSACRLPCACPARVQERCCWSSSTSCRCTRGWRHASTSATGRSQTCTCLHAAARGTTTTRGTVMTRAQCLCRASPPPHSPHTQLRSTTHSTRHCRRGTWAPSCGRPRPTWCRRRCAPACSVRRARKGTAGGASLPSPCTACRKVPGRADWPAPLTSSCRPGCPSSSSRPAPWRGCRGRACWA